MIEPTRYPIEVFFSEEDGGYIAVARDLPGCSAFGETREQALAEINCAIEGWQRAAETAGNPIPEPSNPASEPLPSGKLLLRLPRSLHAALIGRAKKESVSLNQYLVSTLSASTAVDLFAVETPSQWPFREGGPVMHVTTAAVLRGSRAAFVAALSGPNFVRINTSENKMLSATSDYALDVRSLPAGIPVVQREKR